MAGGTVVIVGADRIHRPQLRQSLDSLETAGAHLFGIVMNKIARREAAAYAYGSGYTSYQPKIRPKPTQPKRSWNADDTLVSPVAPQNGHKSAGRVR
jgi:hypothetical protein